MLLLLIATAALTSNKNLISAGGVGGAGRYVNISIIGCPIAIHTHLYHCGIG